MPSRRSDRGRMLAKALSPQNKENVDLALQFTEPYGTIRGVQDLKEDPSDPWNYLAAVPMLGRAAAFAKAIRKGNINDLPKENQWRYDESTTPQEMRQHYAEDYIGDLQDAELQGQDLIDEVMELKAVDEDLYQAVGENMPSYMKNVDTTPPKTFSQLDVDAQRYAMQDAQEIVADLIDAPPEELAQTLSDLAQNDPPVLELVKRALDLQ